MYSGCFWFGHQWWWGCGHIKEGDIVYLTMDFDTYDGSGALFIAVNNPCNQRELPFIIKGPVTFAFSMVGGGD